MRKRLAKKLDDDRRYTVPAIDPISLGTLFILDTKKDQLHLLPCFKQVDCLPCQTHTYMGEYCCRAHCSYCRDGCIEQVKKTQDTPAELEPLT